MRQIMVFMGALSLVAVLMIGYISQYVQQLQTSYRIQAKQKRIQRLEDEYKIATYDLQLARSPVQLEKLLGETGLPLIQPKDVKFVQNPFAAQPALFVENVKSNHFGLTDFVSEAHADSSVQR